MFTDGGGLQFLTTENESDIFYLIKVQVTAICFMIKGSKVIFQSLKSL